MKNVLYPSKRRLPGPNESPFLRRVLIGVVAIVILSSICWLLKEDTTTGAAVAPPINISSLERELFRQLNSERTSQAAQNLSWSIKIAAGSRKHSGDMAESQLLAGEFIPGRDYLFRYGSVGLSCNYHGEILSKTDKLVAEEILAEMLLNNSHADNLLNPLFEKVGIGAEFEKELYLTLDFCG